MSRWFVALSFVLALGRLCVARAGGSPALGIRDSGDLYAEDRQL